jgi:DNA-binding NtrC family response regulator
MNVRLVLLLTRDRALENLLAEALKKNGASLLFARDVAEALQMVCGRIRELDLAVIDLDHGCQGMTLLSAINTCRPELRIMVTASADSYHVASLAYANGAAACLAKPINADELEIVIRKLDKPKLELVAI